ncbi:MAG: adenylate cyclase [Bradyrhizobium sp.]|jgi:adenylate cyclase|nr:adenylate cyclase [Bradyrhizobium sp.]
MSMHAPDLKALTDWLIDGARSEPNPAKMMAEACERAVAAGLPLWRVGIFIRTLHPDIFGRRFIWKPGSDVEIGTVDFSFQDSPEFSNSPLSIVFREGIEIRVRADDPSSKRFPIIEGLRAEGVTDYLALPLLFMSGQAQASSWTTTQPGGFTNDQIDALRRLVVPLARVVEIISLQRTAALLLDTYVGNRAGERILAGQIRRGHTDTMNAAIWLSDLRGFTRLSDRLPSEIVVDILNRYFDCQVEAITRRGGEVLKFMGDGLLAVFPVARADGNAADICNQVLDAVQECRASVAELTYSEGGHTVEKFRFGLALHIGTVLYGNIGGANRLDFTCIGPAVNLAARLEKIASNLHRTVVASASFAESCSTGSWCDLGEFPIAGFSKAERVYGLADEIPAAS